MTRISCLMALTFAAPLAHAAPDGGGTTSTQTATRASAKHPGLSREDLELALQLEFLENYELLENWELVELMPALEEDEP